MSALFEDEQIIHLIFRFDPGVSHRLHEYNLIGQIMLNGGQNKEDVTQIQGCGAWHCRQA